MNIQDFSLSFIKKLHPPEKSPPFFPATPSKNEGPVKPPFIENLVGGSMPPGERFCKSVNKFARDWFLPVTLQEHWFQISEELYTCIVTFPKQISYDFLETTKRWNMAKTFFILRGTLGERICYKFVLELFCSTVNN